MNLNRRSILAVAAAVPASTFSAQFLSPNLGVQAEFFNAQHYANHNADLLVAGYKNYEQLRIHWINFGISEGRIAHPAFHAASYRARYPDLQAAFGNNTAAYYWHYVNHGQYEGRDARQANALIARLGDVSIGASPRCAGAVDSLWVQDEETINSYDKGRQLQKADYDMLYQGCYNPTQAGGMTDGLGYTTSSQMLYGAVLNGGRTLHTRSRPAFWTKPGESIGWADMFNCTAHNTTVLSDFIFDTKYTLNARNNVTVIDYDAETTIGTNIPANRYMSELTTGYHTSEFNTAYEIVPDNGYAARLRNPAQGFESPYPAIITKPDGSLAIGAYSKPVPGSVTLYATWLWKFGLNQQTNDASKWTIIRRYADAVTVGQIVPARCYIVAGQVTDVHMELKRLMEADGF